MTEHLTFLEVIAYVIAVVMSTLGLACAWIKYFASVKPVVIDGLLYVAIAVCGAFIAGIGDSESYKYFDPYFIFYAKFAASLILQAANALKMFRSTGYAQHLAEQEQAKQKTNP